MNLWTSEEITKILIQLDERKLPFSKYAVCQDKGELKLLGRGGSSLVYETKERGSDQQKYAMKVIGFRSQNIDSERFEESIRIQENIDYYFNVVRIYDCSELWLELDENDNIRTAFTEKPESISRTTIKLQFVVMEKIPSVITRTKAGNIKIIPKNLATGDEQEILKLAYDIGTALNKMHHNNVLHRDIKLENVFYSEQEQQYKLGDFGVSKETDNGFAETVAFTKGYAAPEVRISDEKYDSTADIYSFGMMLYVLSNRIRFPESNTYNVNSSVQYLPGYVVPYPDTNISKELYCIISKACMYNPDDRYQTVDEMLTDIEKLLYGFDMGYKKEHRKTSLVVGTLMLLVGITAWKLTMATDIAVSFSVMEYIFLTGCLVKGVLKVIKLDSLFVSILIFGIGIYLLIGTGFSWMKLILILMMTFSSGISSGYLAAGALLANFISVMQSNGIFSSELENGYNWVTITAISIAVILLFQYVILTGVDRKTIKQAYPAENIDLAYWGVICLIYVFLAVIGMLLNSNIELARQMTGDKFVDFFCSFNLAMVGLSGAAFCFFWIGRERVLLLYKKSRKFGSRLE